MLDIPAYAAQSVAVQPSGVDRNLELGHFGLRELRATYGKVTSTAVIIAGSLSVVNEPGEAATRVSPHLPDRSAFADLVSDRHPYGVTPANGSWLSDAAKSRGPFCTSITGPLPKPKRGAMSPAGRPPIYIA